MTVQYYTESAELEGVGTTWQRSRTPPEVEYSSLPAQVHRDFALGLYNCNPLDYTNIAGGVNETR
jgi:hypothetical protein